MPMHGKPGHFRARIAKVLHEPAAIRAHGPLTQGEI